MVSFMRPEQLPPKEPIQLQTSPLLKVMRFRSISLLRVAQVVQQTG